MPASSGDDRLTRYTIVLPVMCTTQTPSRSRAQVGWTRNMGESGTCLVLPERLPENQPLRLCFQTDGGHLKAEGRVVWVGQLGLDLIRHGIAFTRIAPEHRRALRDLLLVQGHVRPAGLRLSVSMPISCRCRGLAGPPVQGRTGDISRGGLLLCLPRVLSAGTELVGTLQTPAGPLTLGGTIVWVEASKRRLSSESIRHGLQFTILDAAIELALARLLTEIPRSMPPSAGKTEALRQRP